MIFNMSILYFHKISFHYFEDYLLTILILGKVYFVVLNGEYIEMMKTSRPSKLFPKIGTWMQFWNFIIIRKRNNWKMQGIFLYPSSKVFQCLGKIFNQTIFTSKLCLECSWLFWALCDHYWTTLILQKKL